MLEGGICISRNIDQWSGEKVRNGGRWEGACGRGEYQGDVLIVLVSPRLLNPTTKGKGGGGKGGLFPSPYLTPCLGYEMVHFC